MRIAIFSETYLPDINGVATHVKILSEGLKAQGHEILVVTADWQSKRNVIKNNVLYCPAIRAKKLYNYSLSSPISFGRFKIVKEFSPDIIHIHNEFGIGLSGKWIARMLKIPYIYTLHTVYDEYIYYIAKDLFVPIITGVSHAYFRMIAKSAAALTGPSVKAVDFFKNKCKLPTAVNVIANPVELDAFSPEKADKNITKAFKQQLGLNDDMTVACFCGRLGREKNIDTLLKFWAETVHASDNYRLVLIGDGPCRDELEDLALSLGVSDTVFFVGKIPHDILPAYLCGCQVYITASMTEMHSISMLEAMAAGLPVLYINDPSNAVQIDVGNNGFIFNNAFEMFERLEFIRNLTRDEYQKFSLAVRRSVSFLSAENLSSVMAEIYSDAILTSKKKGKYEKAY